MASSQQSNFKVAYIKEDKTIGFYTQLANDKEAGYIAVGSAITSYARNFTIRAAQQTITVQTKMGSFTLTLTAFIAPFLLNKSRALKFIPQISVAGNLKAHGTRDSLFAKRHTLNTSLQRIVNPLKSRIITSNALVCLNVVKNYS